MPEDQGTKREGVSVPEIIRDERVYSLSTYFPGKAVSYYVGCDNEYKHIGELATVDSINRNYFNGMNVTEFFRTDGNFDKANLTNSLFGTHNGTITPNQTITVSKMYTYSCSGTGGHSEYVRIWNSSTLNVTAKCEEFIDANGKKYNNRIPAIRLWA